MGWPIFVPVKYPNAAVECISFSIKHPEWVDFNPVEVLESEQARVA
jgi:hypothetical protein